MVETKTRTIHKPGVETRPMQPKPSLAKYRVMVEDVAQQSGNNPEAAAPSMLWLAGPDTLIVFPLVLDEDPVIQVRMVAYGIDQAELPRPDWVCYFSEGFHASGTKDQREDLSRLEKYELHDRHMIGMSGVGEGVVGHMVHKDGRSWIATQSYHRQPIGSRPLRWDEPVIVTSDDPVETGGHITELLEMMVGIRPWGVTHG